MAYVRIYDAAGFGLGDDADDLFGDDFDLSEMNYKAISNDRVRLTGTFDNGLEFVAVASDVSTTPAIRFMEFSDNGSPILTLSGIRLDLEDDTAFDRLLRGPDEIVGNKYADIFDAEGGNDILRGQGGNDRLLGGFGDDRLFGGWGADRLNGGRGQDRLDAGVDGAADVIVFRSAADSAVGARHDIVLNFDRDDDRIDLSAIDARLGTTGNDDFTWGGRTGGDARVWWTATSDGVLLKGDRGGDGDSRPDFEILLSDLGSLGRDDVLL
ncbi:hypothetical protein FHG66_03685 [Rubellimicrobium rubrum]|uniref:Uncharacterized protein n=1 Tax=Rubellimicrobium rubrum TaxID=2585369 RepID=A0A5C4N358_9RHOB|nr:M10 family metallopeptidase C-terminal domain-containing protein [Rubellimicrobium rubrum]TNC51922.1 hypothetical protein FHG66_03685 [Rubellimicrobium rubrum]